jgi:hypothetical protein
MDTIDKVVRWTALFVSVAIFLTLLPIVLSYSLGYKIDYREFKIYKTGIISIRSNPSGAVVHINGRIFQDLTPARLEDLKPGKYNIEVRKEGYNPWNKELVVRPNMVTKAEDIVLFPLSKDITKIVNKDFSGFAISGNNYLYCMTSSGFYRSNLDGTNLVRMSPFGDWPGDIKGIIFSPDGEKLIYYNEHYIWVIFLRSYQADKPVRIDELLKSEELVRYVFWYSQSTHIVFLSGKDVNVIELGPQGSRNVVSLYRFDSEPRNVIYDPANDSLYYTDTGRMPGQKERSSLYRLNLREKFFDKFMERFKKEPDSKNDKK